MFSIFSFEMTLTPFLDNFNELLVKRFGISYTDAGKLILVPWTFYMICAIPMGKILSVRPKWRRSVFVLGVSVYSILMLGLYLIENTGQPGFWHYAYVAAFLFWFSFCLAVNYIGLTTATVYLVSENTQGAAWGVCSCVISLSQCLLPLIIIWIVGDNPKLDEAYKELTGVNFILTGIPLACAILMKCMDRFEGIDVTYAEKEQT